MGLYFTQKGPCCRPSQVLYDRADSAVSKVSRGDFDWNVILERASWFHVTGITPALSAGAADSTFEALEACRAKGIPSSCDLNYRKKLWKWGKKPTEVMPQVARMVSLLIANEEDCQKALGIELDVDVAAGALDEGRYHGLALRVLDYGESFFAELPTARTGTYVEEVLSAGRPWPAWNFGDEGR